MRLNRRRVGQAHHTNTLGAGDGGKPVDELLQRLLADRMIQGKSLPVS